MTLNQRKEMQITPVYLCLNFSNSVLRLSKTGTLAQGEILFANHPRTYSESEFANILTMLHIQKVKTTDDIVVESKLYTKARIKNAGKILASFTNDLSECEIFALKKTYENEYLKKIRKELLLVLAKVDENNRSITYLKTTFNIKGKGYTLFPFFFIIR